MTPCPEWRDRVTEHALGLPAGDRLAAHLAGCVGCAGALAALRARAGELDAALRGLVAVEPSPDLPARVLARLDAAPAPRWPRRMAWVAASLIIALGVAVGLYRTPPPTPLARELSRWRSPAEALLRAPVEPQLTTVPRLGEIFFEVEPGGRDAL